MENSSYFYAHIDDNGYCVGLLSNSEPLDKDFMVRLDNYDELYLNRKYDKELKEWTDEYLTEDSKNVLNIENSITDSDIIQAELLKSQALIENKLNELMNLLEVK